MRKLMPPAAHGGPDRRELERLGIDPRTLLDFSVCTNPFGPSPRVQAALASVALDRYPDRDAGPLRVALALLHDVTCEQVLCGNGASELIWLVALALIEPGGRVLIAGPTYAEYGRAAALAGANITRLDSSFRVRAAPAAIVDSCPDIERQLPSTDLAFLCNPNNPTGSALTPERIVQWAKRHGDTVFVIDEAYQPFAPDVGSLAGCGKRNILVLRSMTKAHALAGLRLGYAVGDAAVIARLAHAQPPWSVNAMAQAAGLAALEDRDHLQHVLSLVRRESARLRQGLHELDLQPLASAAHYFLLPSADAAALRLALLRRGCLVRDCASFGLPGHVRLSPRCPNDNDQLLRALREVLR